MGKGDKKSEKGKRWRKSHGKTRPKNKHGLLRALDPPNAPEPDVAASAHRFARIAAYPDYAVYLAEEDGVPVGTFALLVMDNLAHGGAPEGVVENVVVAEGRRGQGIGRALMRFAMDRCAAAGCYKLVLSSNVQREAAHRFYEDLGFVQHGLSFSVPLGGQTS
jgi:ribosomal small subunit protein bTHX